jgi:spermidine synthase
VGPAETLYTSEFYSDMRAALRAGGIICTQGECIWLHLDLIAKVMGDAGQLFPIVDYSKTSIPSYPSGTIGFIMCSTATEGVKLNTPAHHPDEELQS